MSRNHVIEMFEEQFGEAPEGIVHLQVTKPFVNLGTVVRFVALDIDNNEYLLTVDHRPGHILFEGLMRGEEEIVVGCEPWMIARLPKNWGVG